MAPRLKTYAAEIDGLHEWIVAAPNQAAALDAFGIGQDLFAQGLAHVETDAAKVEAATARPGVALRRLKGSSAAFEPVTVGGASDWSAALSAAAGQPKPARAVKAQPAAEPARPDRSALDEAEAAIKALEAERDQSLSDFAAEREALDEREAALKARFKARLDKAKARANAEGDRYRQAGGK